MYGHLMPPKSKVQKTLFKNMTGPLPLGTSPDVPRGRGPVMFLNNVSTSPDVPRAVRVSSMKVLTEVCIENVPCWNPGTFLWAVSLPVNQVLQPATNLTGIHNTADGEGWLASNNTGGAGLFQGQGPEGK